MQYDQLKDSLRNRLQPFAGKFIEIGVLDQVQKEVQAWWFEHKADLEKVKGIELCNLEFYPANKNTVGRRAIPSRCAKPWPKIQFSYRA